MAVKMIEGNDDVRVKKCIQAINEVLSAFDCVMAPVITLGPQGVVNAQCAIQPLPRGPEGNGPETPDSIKEQVNKAKKPMGPRPS